MFPLIQRTIFPGWINVDNVVSLADEGVLGFFNPDFVSPLGNWESQGSNLVRLDRSDPGVAAVEAEGTLLPVNLAANLVGRHPLGDTYGQVHRLFNLHIHLAHIGNVAVYVGPRRSAVQKQVYL